MEATWQTRSSFLFGTVDMYQQFGIKIADDGLPKDLLFPDLRPRKVTNPLRHGSYDYGAKYYNERPIPVGCVTDWKPTRADARELAYVLSRKSSIRFWHEPDKFYIGRVYEGPTLEELRNVGHKFTLNFILEPFAYGDIVTGEFEGTMLHPDYKGTAPAPTVITIRNVGTTPITGIQITQISLKENI